MLNEVVSKDILYFDNFEAFFYHFNICGIRMSHTIDVLIQYGSIFFIC